MLYDEQRLLLLVADSESKIVIEMLLKAASCFAFRLLSTKQIRVFKQLWLEKLSIVQSDTPLPSAPKRQIMSQCG